MNVAFIGMGAMGSAIARNLMAAGHRLSVYNRTPERARPLVEAGARLAASPADAAREAAAVFTMLADDQAVEAVTFGADGLLGALDEAAVHVSMSTISVALCERLAATHRDAGRGFVAAPVLGRPAAAAQAKLFVAAAGEASAMTRVMPLLEVLSQRVTVVAESPAQASVLKLIANFLISTVIESVGEAHALARKSGLDSHAMLEFLTGAIFNAPVYKTYGPLIVDGKFEPPGFALPLGQKDNRLVLQAAEALNVAMPFAAVVRERFLVARSQGWDGRDWSAIGSLAGRDAAV
jgi:3-hydroxyisobutyrate dehydrogenase-like beta-hydroxyacid dehydrogenase